MTADLIVWDPEQIDTISEVDEYLNNIVVYEHENKCRAGVLLTQRMHAHGLYEITSQQEALDELRKPITRDLPEFGIKFYPLSYFLALHKRLSGNASCPLPEPLDRDNLDTYRF